MKGKESQAEKEKSQPVLNTLWSLEELYEMLLRPLHYEKETISF